MPSVIGNAVGGLLVGYIIKKYTPLFYMLNPQTELHRTGKYKTLSIIGAISSSASYTLMILRWHGHTSFLESLYITPGGFGNGIALSTTFIALTAGIKQSQMAIASSGLYLSSNIGMVSGLSIAAAILQSGLRKELRIGLEAEHDREQVSFREICCWAVLTVIR
jgi:MFS family permease